MFNIPIGFTKTIGSTSVPTSLSGLVWWNDASDTSSITGTSLASAIANKSGSGGSLTQGTTGNQPATNSRTQNGLNVLDFDGTDDYMTATLSAIADDPLITVFMVVKYDVLNNNHVPFSQGTMSSVNGYGLGYNKPANVYNNFFYGGEIISSSITPSTNCVIERMTRDGSTMKIGVNGTENSITTSSKNITNKVINIGHISSKSWPFNGFIGELIIYNRALSGTENTIIENYLNDKWAVY